MVERIINDIVEHCELFGGIVAFVTMASFALCRIITKRWLTVMILSQLSFVVNTSVVIYLYYWQFVVVDRFMYFILLELAVTLAILVTYRRIRSRRRVIIERISRLNLSRVAMMLVMAFVVITIFNSFVVPSDGSSRIQYTTNRWYSYLRIVFTIVTPLGYFLAAYLLLIKKYISGLLLGGGVIAYNISSGSKAGFLLAAVAAVLLARDFTDAKLKIRLHWVVIYSTLLVASALFALNRLGVTTESLLVRVLRESEATIMVYMSPDVNEASEGLSLLAVVHRGVARAFGDAGANDIDTLFGFKLSAIYYGANTFTGPNSSIPAYFLSNYYGQRLVLGIAVICGYCLIILGFNRFLLGLSWRGYVLLVPFTIYSINSFPQDYYSGMGDLTAIGIATIAIVLFDQLIVHKNANNCNSSKRRAI